ncbi:hypothetical protein HGRIS_001797 [Hohenbuehelia grisea]|uniref:Dynamin N-terminal domain-containing protein n=1 Tax=Hohenbuehelia grisea TaxID=104357 RepID=A0ABR3JJH3_9AGAR
MSTHSNDDPARTQEPAIIVQTVALDAVIGLASSAASSGRGSLDIVVNLQNTGVQADIDIPQIVVVGSQSVGKSSVIESIAGITLPRHAGTCTRDVSISSSTDLV